VLMAIDVGNTQIVVGLFDDNGSVGTGELVHQWRVHGRRGSRGNGRFMPNPADNWLERRGGTWCGTPSSTAGVD